MATSGPELRALTAAANEQAQQAKLLISQAKQKVEEAKSAYARISLKVEGAVSACIRADSSLDEGWQTLNTAIQVGENYMSGL